MKIAVILSGCGYLDGAEIHEATLTLLAIHRHGAEYSCFAPDIMQHHVVNHLTGQEMMEKRNVLVEAARIARGNIKPVSEFNGAEFDALVLPGGFGAAKNLCDYAFKGPDCRVDDGVSSAILAMHSQKKPIGALCISPVLLARLLPGVQLTIGCDPDTAKHVEEMGAEHRQTDHTEIIVDTANRVVTTPCYMLDSRVDQIADGAENVIKALLEMAG